MGACNEVFCENNFYAVDPCNRQSLGSVFATVKKLKKLVLMSFFTKKEPAGKKQIL